MRGDADSPRPTHSELCVKSCADFWGLAGAKYISPQSHSYESGREIPGSPRYSTQLASWLPAVGAGTLVPSLVVACDVASSCWVHEEFSWVLEKVAIRSPAKLTLVC